MGVNGGSARTLTICPGSPCSRLFMCFVFRLMSLTITVLLCLKIREISPTLPLSWPEITFTVSPTFTCILWSTGRLFGLQSFLSHRLSCTQEWKVGREDHPRAAILGNQCPSRNKNPDVREGALTFITMGPTVSEALTCELIKH